MRRNAALLVVFVLALFGAFLAGSKTAALQSSHPLSPAFEDHYWANWNCQADGRPDHTEWHYCSNDRATLGFWNMDLVKVELDLAPGEAKAGDVLALWGTPQAADYVDGGARLYWGDRAVFIVAPGNPGADVGSMMYGYGPDDGPDKHGLYKGLGNSR